MRGGASATGRARVRLARPVVSESIAERYSRLAREGAGGRAELQRPGQHALVAGGDLLDDLLLEREQPLRAAVEPQPGLGRLDAPPGAVEQLGPEPLLERPHLQADGGLGDPEPLRGLREAAPLDDGAEGGELTRIHKRSLYLSDETRRRGCGGGRRARPG